MNEAATTHEKRAKTMLRWAVPVGLCLLSTQALAAGSWQAWSDQSVLKPFDEMRAEVAERKSDACKPQVRDFRTTAIAPGGGMDIEKIIETYEKMLADMKPTDPSRGAIEQTLKLLREQRDKGTKVVPLPVGRQKGAMTLATALGNAEKLLGAPARKVKPGGAAEVGGALAAKNPKAALAVLLANHRASPKNAMTLVNLAGVLTLTGLPHEAIAVLDAADALGGTLPSPAGVPGRAVALSNRGHAYLGLGRWQEAEAPLRDALKLAPDFSEARLNLSQALLCRGNVDGATKELRVALRRTIAPESADLLLKEKTPGKHGDGLAPREQSPTRRPAKQLFDLSRGATFDLPQLKLPRNRREALVLHEQYLGLERAGRVELEKLHAKATAVNLSQRLDPGDLRWFKVVNGAINTSHFEPEVWGAYKSAYDAHYALQKAFRPLSDTRNKTIEAGLAGLPSPHTCADVDKVYDDAYQTYMDALRPYVKGQEQAMARYVSARVKHETALAANLPDPAVRTAKRAAIEASAKSSFYGPVVYGAILISDVFPLACTNAQLPNVALELAPLPELGADPCGGLLSSTKLKSKVPSSLFKADGFGMSFSVSCKKVDIEIAASAAVGLFGQASLDWRGGATLFAGIKAELKLPKGVPVKGGLGAKEGVYVKFGKDGVEDAGLRVEAKAAIGAGPDAGVGQWEGKFEQEFGIAAAAAYWFDD